MVHFHFQCLMKFLSLKLLFAAIQNDFLLLIANYGSTGADGCLLILNVQIHLQFYLLRMFRSENNPCGKRFVNSWRQPVSAHSQITVLEWVDNMKFVIPRYIFQSTGVISVISNASLENSLCSTDNNLNWHKLLHFILISVCIYIFL